MDAKKRSWAKSVSWRVIGVLILGIITYAITRDLGKTTGITVIFHGIRLFLYYYHERAWERIEWGRRKHPLAHLPVRGDLTHEDHQDIKKFLAERKYMAESPEYQI